MARLSGCSATRSALFPARAMMMFSFACLCSSLTHAFALSREDYAFISPAHVRKRRFAYSLRDIVDDHSAVGIPVVHRS